MDIKDLFPEDQSSNALSQEVVGSDLVVPDMFFHLEVKMVAVNFSCRLVEETEYAKDQIDVSFDVFFA